MSNEFKRMFFGCSLSTIAAIGLQLIGPHRDLVAQELQHGWSTDFPKDTLSVVEVKPDVRATTFVLKNISGKHITAFTVSRGDVAHTIDYFETDTDLAPGATHSLPIGNEEVSGPDHILRLSTVIFVDGTTVGVQSGIDDILGSRLGITLETTRVTQILDSAGSLNGGDDAVEALKDRIGKLPRTSDEAFASVREVRLGGVDPEALRADRGKPFADGFLGGVHTARELAAWRLNQLKQVPLVGGGGPGRPSREGALSQLRDLYRALSTRNQTSLTQIRGIRQ